MYAKEVIVPLIWWVMGWGACLAADIPHGTGSWDAKNLGNHRVVIRVNEKGDAVRVRIAWRRRDLQPENKSLLLFDAATNQRVLNVWRGAISREAGEIVFQPQTVPGDYYVYFLPNTTLGSPNYPKVAYPSQEQTAAKEWLARHQLAAEFTGEKWRHFPAAKVVEIQAIDEFNRFSPMEEIATAEELKTLLARHPGATYLVFPEDRSQLIRMTTDLPSVWIQKGAQSIFYGEAARGEFYAFQLGVWAARQSLQNVRVSFTDLMNPLSREVIPAAAFQSFNTGGIDWEGKKFQQTVSIKLGEVQSFWCGVQVDERVTPGEYSGFAILKPDNTEEQRIRINLKVTATVMKDAGDGEPWRHSRLRWLNSQLAADDSLVAPFIPVQIDGSKVNCLGRQLTIAPGGLPQSIQSFFHPEMTRLTTRAKELLSSPINLAIEKKDGEKVLWGSQGPQFARPSEGAAEWQASSRSKEFSLNCRGRLEFDGNIEFTLDLKALQTIPLNDIRLEIPLAADVARYMMGMGVRGGLRPREYHWKWDPRKNQDSAWVGDVNAGLQVTFKDENYVRPLNTNFYLLKPLNMPPSWFNEGKGGCDFVEGSSGSFLIRSYSGPRTVLAGETLHFNFRLMITPFKPIDPHAQFSTRYYHAFKPVEEVAASGANTINIHHANAVNPYINYPFLRPAEMKAYVDEAHSLGMRVKIYYTVRELSNHAPELFALRSLGNEVFAEGPGGGFSWLQEHLASNYIAAWFVPELQDAAIINNGISRWHNYYVEGLDWLVKNVGIDGLYIDDVAFDRTTMKRVRRVLDRGRPGAMIDLHSANQFNVRDGFANSANLYLEHFPYLNRLWFGEYFDYNSSPDFWLVELSGIPFGLMGEMLQDHGNPWRGMIYGMTNRLPHSGDPRPLWKAWDEFGIIDSHMIGYWAPDCPVKTGHPQVLATAYVRPGKTLLALASWAKETVQCKLEIDWGALNLDPAKVKILSPEIKDFQPAAEFSLSDPIPVEPGKGWLLVLSAKP